MSATTLDDYRAELPDLTDEELERLRWTLRGLARDVVDRYVSEKAHKTDRGSR